MTSKEGPVLVLGAGPEGRAVVYALFSLGVSEVLLYDENKARQAEGVKRMAMAALETAGRVDPLEGPVDESVLRCTGIVNATRKGYAPPQFLVSFTYVISTFFKNARNHVFRSKMREISEFYYVNQIKSNGSSRDHPGLPLSTPQLASATKGIWLLDLAGLPVRKRTELMSKGEQRELAVSHGGDVVAGQVAVQLQIVTGLKTDRDAVGGALEVTM